MLAKLQPSAVIVRTAFVLSGGGLKVAAAAIAFVCLAIVLCIWLLGGGPCVLIAAVVQRDGLQLAACCRRSRPLASLPARGRCTCSSQRTLHARCSSAYTAGQLL